VKLLPYDSFTIQTSDPVHIVRERLATQIEPQKPMRWNFFNYLPYEGTLSETGFKIRRIIHYRNSFLPLIRGQFEPSPSGTIVRITLRLHPAAIAFWIVWYLVLYSFFFHMWLTKAMPVAAAWHFLGFSIALLAVFWAAFWAEAHRSRRDLVQMIQGYTDRQQTSL
jgi:hypothetical protein